MRESQQKSRRLCIVGGGISGLAAAHRLLELRSQETSADSEHVPVEVLLLEASARAGGTVRTYRREGFLLEGGPDSFISEKPAALELAKRLGLSDRIIQTNEQHRRSFVVSRGRLRPTPEGFQLLAPSRMLPFLTTDIFTWRGKARMALDLVLPRRKSANGSDDESLAAFVRRRFGQEALERMAQPMVGGIYTADPESLSLRATMPRFLEMERRDRSLILSMWKAARASKDAARHGRGASGARYSLFLSFDEGTQVLTDALAARLPESTLRLNTRVESLARDAGRWLLRTSEGETIEADAVCLALPAYASARLLRGVDESLADELEAIPYASTATVNLAYERARIPHPLDGFGFVVPFVERRATLACTFSSVKFAGRAPEGKALLRAFVGGALQPDMFELDEAAMIDAVRRDLRDLLGVNAPPLLAHVEKWPRSMAQYHLGHTQRLARIRSSLKQHDSLALCGNAYEGAGLPDCVRSGESAAETLYDARVVS
ncbi:MAG TPA: protoporphyrinogen oxidase [Pyrinomonadaceae bacterium]|jgi:oxygen-dependent protoporphyrinogen oxidase|nr:protoporphyrinogen oxidase [Pyrinomonadaceae bacterium]